MADKTYRGHRSSEGCVVRVNDQPLDPRHDLNHSRLGFEWGYAGSEPAQLALAILADCVGDERAGECHQAFQRQVISRLNRTCWELSDKQVDEWVRAWYAKRGL
ncbi:MAG: DUF6166 domain-containing protein [Planctomycetota bacterium]|jgi:hypothetical protein